jgi:hypothetical protein
MPRLCRRRAQRPGRHDDPQPGVGAVGVAPSAHLFSTISRAFIVANPLVSRAGDVEIGWGHALLDHLVGAEQDRLRDGKPECLRSLAVDHQLELDRLLYGKFGGFRPLEDLVDEVCGPQI